MKPALPLLLVSLFSCGGAGTTEPRSPGSEGRSGESAEEALLLCHDNGGPNRTDYQAIGSWRCPDGSTPLGGDPGAGAAARIGNVGEGPDGHVVDLYEVPCRPTPVRVYVDAYHCGGESMAAVDLSNLSEEQLANLASNIRGLEQEPLSEWAAEHRPNLLGWLQETEQVSVGLCGEVVGLVDVPGYVHTPLLVQQLYLSAAATLIEERGQIDSSALHARALAGALDTYAVIRQARPHEASADFDSLLRRRSDGSLGDELGRRLAACAQPASGTIMTTDGQNVWPPQGPSCERLVRCCEARGYIRNGVAVDDGDSSMFGTMCQLAAATDDCAGGLEGLAEVGERCADFEGTE